MVWRSGVPSLSARIAARVLVLTRVPVTPARLVSTGAAGSKDGPEWRTAWLEAIQEHSATLASLATIRRGLGHL